MKATSPTLKNEDGHESRESGRRAVDKEKKERLMILPEDDQRRERQVQMKVHSDVSSDTWMSGGEESNSEEER